MTKFYLEYKIRNLWKVRELGLDFGRMRTNPSATRSTLPLTKMRAPSSGNASRKLLGRSPERIEGAARVQHEDFMLKNTELDEAGNKYCRCLLKVAAGGGASSPYAVCTNSVGQQVHSCSQYYDWDIMPLHYLNAYADLHKIHVTNRNNRNSVLRDIQNWKESRGESF